MSTSHHISDDVSHKSTCFILALCAGWFGLQQIFTVFYANGYFYMASLGFSDTLISLTWLSGPVAGMFFQPFIGSISDNCAHSWGKRRPFIVAGTLILVVAMISLSWAEELIDTFSGIPKRESGIEDTQPNGPNWALLILVSTSILVANFAIQPIQLGLRAMIVDVVPIHQQAQAHSYAAKINIVSSIVGYGLGSVDLTDRLGFLGQSQLQVLCSLVSLILTACVTITCYCVRERIGDTHDYMHPSPATRKYRLPSLGSLYYLPVAKKVCFAQFFCWLGWFPFLYYIAKYVSGFQNVTSSPQSVRDLSRTGSFAMLIFALASLAATVFLSWLSKLSYSSYAAGETKMRRTAHYHRESLFSLPRIWFACQIIFFICMMSTFVIKSLESAYIFVAFIGLPWAAGTWIPFSIISEEIRRSRINTLEAGEKEDGQDLTATVVGIHNSAISAPQILAALGSSILFLFIDSGETNKISNGLEVWLLRAGGLSALVSACIIRKLPRQTELSV